MQSNESENEIDNDASSTVCFDFYCVTTKADTQRLNFSCSFDHEEFVSRDYLTIFEFDIDYEDSTEEIFIQAIEAKGWALVDVKLNILKNLIEAIFWLHVFKIKIF